MRANEFPNLSEYAAKLIKHKARRLAGRFGFTDSDCADVEQEIGLHLLESNGCFDERRGKHNTFVSRIVDHRIISILRERSAQKRDYRRSVSLQEVMCKPGHDTVEPVDRRCAQHAEPNSDLAIDLAQVIERFDTDARRLCRLLMHESIAETARRLGLTRAEARTRIARIQKLLTDHGLDVYVKAGAAESDSECVSN